MTETISTNPAKLQPQDDEDKRKSVLMRFLVDVEVRSAGGKPVLYCILDVKDVILPD
jgi:hypothetical protein